MINCS